MSLSKIVLMGSLLACCLEPQARSQEQEPLLVSPQGVGQIFRLAPPVYGVLLERQRPMQLDISHTFTNYWSRDRRYRIDDEMIDDEARLTYQWQKRVRLGLGFNVRRFAHTASDQVAITFHKLMFMGQDGRLEAGKNKLIYRVPDYNLQYTAADRNRSFSELLQADLTLPLSLEALQPLNMAFTVMGSFENAEGGPFPHGSMDKGWQLNLSYPLAQGSVFGSLTYLAFDQQPSNPVALYWEQMGWTLGAGHHLDANQELLGQVMVYQPVFRQMGQLSRNSYEIHLAYRYHWEQYALEATLIENIFWIYNTPDWGLCVGLRSAI